MHGLPGRGNRVDFMGGRRDQVTEGRWDKGRGSMEIYGWNLGTFGGWYGNLVQ